MKKLIFCLFLLLSGCFSENIVNVEEKSTREVVESIPIPKVSKPAGTYIDSVFVYGAVLSKGSFYLRYTIDGTEPTKYGSNMIGAGITIKESCTLKLKAFDTSGTSNACSPTLSVNYIITNSFKPETFTYNGIIYKGRTNLGTGNCITNPFELLSVTEPKVSTFECEGYFSLKGNYTGKDISRYMYVEVKKNDTLYCESYFIEGATFDKKIWLRYGKGDYVICISPAPIFYSDYTKDPEYTTSPQVAYVTHKFYVKNNRDEIGIFKYPSQCVQSDNDVIKNKAIEVLTKANKLNGTVRDKSFAIMCYIVDTLTYDYQSSIGGIWRKPQDALYCMSTGNAVCEGYSDLYGAMLRSIGIKAKIVCSKTHAWNEVQDENGNWFLVDCTYNDADIIGFYSQTKFWLSDLTANGENIKVDNRENR